MDFTKFCISIENQHMKRLVFFLCMLIVTTGTVNAQQKTAKPKAKTPSTTTQPKFSPPVLKSDSVARKQHKSSKKAIPKVNMTKFKPPVLKDSIRSKRVRE